MSKNKSKKKKRRVVELFSGLGSQAKALHNLGKNFEVVATCEWDIHAMVAYDRIHRGGELHKDTVAMKREQLLDALKKYKLSSDCKKEISQSTLKQYSVEALRLIHSAIKSTHNKVNIKDLKGQDLGKDIDIMTYSFPCQDLSNVGHFHGYRGGIAKGANTRSGLVWEVERILQERKNKQLDLPKILVLENVTSLTSEKHKDDFEKWQNSLTGLGYHNHIYKLRAQWLGSPQRRYRLIMISVYVGEAGNQALQDKIKEYFEKHPLDKEAYRKTLALKPKTLKDALRLDPSNPKYFVEAKASQPNDTPSRQKIWVNNRKLVDYQNGGYEFSNNVDTITTKQDRHPNAGNIYFDYEGNQKSKFRYLTPRECFLLMGFEEEDYENLKMDLDNPIVRGRSKFFTRDNLIHAAGNSIVVQILEQVFLQVFDILDWMD
ncbi:MAG: DNA (cytosine-5-)-methyltransferase [Firmicutes bacterium]|nr:DNA (cytosine-5-)-methyltransferase [Bacillota bacterium]